MSRVGIFLLLALVSLASAGVIFRKSLQTEYFARGVDTTVELRVYNLGEDAIVDVDLQDRWPEEHFNITGGLIAHWDSIEGGANVSHRFQIKPSFEGYYQPDRALVSYHIVEGEDEKPTKVIGFSNPLHNVSVLPTHLYEKLHKTLTTEWSIFAGMLAGSIGLPALFWLNYMMNYECGVPKFSLLKKKE